MREQNGMLLEAPSGLVALRFKSLPRHRTKALDQKIYDFFLGWREGTLFELFAILTDINI